MTCQANTPSTVVVDHRHACKLSPHATNTHECLCGAAFSMPTGWPPSAPVREQPSMPDLIATPADLYPGHDYTEAPQDIPLKVDYGSPLDELARALAELYDARGIVTRLLRRLGDTRAATPGPATLEHHLGRLDRLIEAAAECIATFRLPGCDTALRGPQSDREDRADTHAPAGPDLDATAAMPGGPHGSGEVPQ